MATWLRGLGCLTYIPQRGGAERTPASPEWTHHGPPSCFPPATLPIPARVSLRNGNQVLPVPPENLPRASHRTEHNRHALPEFQDPPGCAPYPADFSPGFFYIKDTPAPGPLSASTGPLHLLFPLLAPAPSQGRRLLVSQVSISTSPPEKPGCPI